jgi:hypothetical protein
METRPLFVLLAILLTGGAFADAYTWTDENGVVHYSDRPHPDAETIVLDSSSDPGPQPPTSSPSTSKDESSPAPALPGYVFIKIVNPGAEETMWNIETILNVNLDLEPALKPGHQIRVYFDGMPRAVTSTSFQIEEVYRGVHNIQAEVLSSTGVLLIRSLPSRFYVQQTSVR